jgi:hypothetical protein
MSGHKKDSDAIRLLPIPMDEFVPCSNYVSSFSITYQTCLFDTRFLENFSEQSNRLQLYPFLFEAYLHP